MHILTDTQEEILKEERRLLTDLLLALVSFDAKPEDQETLEDSIHQLDELFLLVVVGEFNSGKSAFINALLGKQMLEEGVTPTTTQINILRYAPVQERQIVNENQHILNLPVDWLDEISIVDTPGTNAIIRAHETITSQFVPRSDLVLFITSADRPFTESERVFLERIRDWGKKVVIVINKIDILQSSSDLEKVINFVKENARTLLGISPEIYPLSARMALRAKHEEPELWVESRFGELENYIRDTLDEKSRIQLKFMNPLGVSLHLTDHYLGIVQSRLDLLKSDFEMLTDVESQLTVYQEDMRRDFTFRMADIENVLFEMENRGQVFFDETFRIARVLDLLSKDRISREFEQNVISDTAQIIEQKVDELIDWLVDADFRQWQAVNDHLSERRRTHQDRIVGDSTGSGFSYDRERLIEGVGRQAQRIVDTYDKEIEAKEIARSAQEAVAASAVLEVGAVGLGTLVSLLASTLAMDVTGILLASFIAALGFFVIPARRRIAKKEMTEKIGELRLELTRSLRNQFEKEISRSINNIHEAIAPYTRFVRAEQSKLLDVQTDLDQIRVSLTRLKSSITEM